jgi:NADH-quinone oxidoreductase subunit J
MVILSKNPVHSVMYLILTFFTIAGQYVLLNAQFLAVVHIIVYAGAIMVLFLFVIMLLNLNAETEPTKSKLIKFAGILAGGLLMLVMIAALKDTVLTVGPQTYDGAIGLVKNLGKVLYGEYLVPFEISTILFLSAMIGAVMLAKKQIN